MNLGPRNNFMNNNFNNNQVNTVEKSCIDEILKKGGLIYQLQRNKIWSDLFISLTYGYKLKT
jgi:hypothetical protein